MKNLFLIDGASGTGKTDMLEYLREKYAGRSLVTVIHKYTTREKRNEEAKLDHTLDLEFITKQKFDVLKRKNEFYYYEYGGGYYAFRCSDVKKALENFQHVFIIVRDRLTIEQLRSDYQNVRIIPVFIYTDRDETIKRLKRDGNLKEAIKFRLDRLQLAWNDYLRHFDLYQEVIINNSNKNDFHRLIDSLVHKYSPEYEPQDCLEISNNQKIKLIKPLIGFKQKIMQKSKDYDNNVFIMMKFREGNKIVYEYIKEQLKQSNLKCVRADQPEWDITQNVYNPLAVLCCCKYGIALFDEPEGGNIFSANVAYELSMMHMQGKECLILRHNKLPEMPFDLIKDMHEKYQRDLELKTIVKKWVSKIQS